MREVALSELKAIQLEIIQAIHTFCEKHNIKYSLGYGSLLGAVRHGGYIPWDDDIDIIMPRSDYDKFVSSFNTFHHTIKVRNHSNYTGYPFPFAKVEDTRTIKNELGYTGLGIAVDVFPIDNIPDSSLDSKHLLRKCRRLILMNQIKFIKWDSRRPLYRNLIVYIIKIPLLFVSFKKLSLKHEKLSISYNSKHTNYAGCLIAFYNHKEIMQNHLFSEYTQIKFENLNLCSIKDYDTYLTNLYGNYMQLPPENKRITHHDFQVFWK